MFGDVNGDGCGSIDNDGDGDGDGDISEPEVVVVVGRISGTSQCLVAHKPPLYPPPAMLCVAQYRG